MRRFAFASTLLAASAALALPGNVASAHAADPDAVRIAGAGHSLEWNWTPPGQGNHYGHAETLIHAPLQVVRSHVLDYRHYRDILPDKFKTSRIIAHGPDGSADVYMQIQVLGGLVTLWDVTRFAPPQVVAPGTEVVRGRMVPGKGNIEGLEAFWTLRAVDDEWTVLKFDVMILPGVPAPQFAVDEETRDSARYAVDAMHDRAQGTPRIEPWPPQ
jgi:hypothetical protein